MDPSANSLEGARASAQQPWLQVQGSRYFLDWLQEQRVSLAFTTYQTGKLFLVGRKPDQAIAVFERTYSHCMGMWAAPDGADDLAQFAIPDLSHRDDTGVETNGKVLPLRSFYQLQTSRQ
jgi:non-ribosomal peptide synthetase component F